MAKIKEKDKKSTKTSHSANSYSSNMTYKQMKREAVSRGMPFTDVVSGDFNSLYAFLDDAYFTKKPDLSLVDKYDQWFENELLKLDPTRKVYPSLRLGYLGEEQGEDNNPRIKVRKEKKEKKQKRVKDENGRVKGTKKSYTYELTTKGYDLERITRRVLKKFPDASEKSIKIWYRDASGQRGVKKEKPIKEKQVRVKKEKTKEEIAIIKQRSKERREARNKARKDLIQKNEDHKKKLKAIKKNKKNGLKV